MAFLSISDLLELPFAGICSALLHIRSLGNGGLSMDGTFSQYFPRHPWELFARTYVTSLILTLSQVSCGDDFLPYRLWKKGGTVLWAGNTQKISNIEPSPAPLCRPAAFLWGQGVCLGWGILQAPEAVFSGQYELCHIQSHVWQSYGLCVLPHLLREHQPVQILVVLLWNHKKFLLTCNIYRILHQWYWIISRNI